MSFRTKMLDVADKLRALAGTDVFDIRTVLITVRTRRYAAGQRSSQSHYVDSNFVLPQQYKVKELKENEISSSGGKYEIGDIKVGPITPRGDTLGYTEAQLAPQATTNGVDIIYVLSGAINGEYTRIEFHSDKPFSYFLVLRRRVTVP